MFWCITRTAARAMEEVGESDCQVENTVLVASQARTVSPLVKRNITERLRRRLSPGTICSIHDKNCPGYGWLLPGRAAEERHMIHGRVYRYYYDPNGRLYHTQAEVLRAWEETGLILVDK